MNMTKKIEFTNNATKQIQKIVLENGTNTYFRISVKGGGCSGFKYSFTFDTIKKNTVYRVYMCAKCERKLIESNSLYDFYRKKICAFIYSKFTK